MLRYALYDIRASLFSMDRFFFGVALPIVFFLLFGAMQEYASQPMGEGNVAAYVMIGMALYGAVQNTVAISGSTVTELSSGWNRQLALTPLTTGKYLGDIDRAGDFCGAGDCGEYCGHVYRCGDAAEPAACGWCPDGDVWSGIRFLRHHDGSADS